LYEASLEASEAIRSKMSETKELRIAMALLLGGGQPESQSRNYGSLTRYQCLGGPA
jgi:hypothetical protein